MNRQPVEVLLNSHSPSLIAERLKHHGIDTIICETQYVGSPRLIKSVLELSWRTALLLGAIGGIMGRINIIECPPSTWQALQRRRLGITGRLPRAEGIALAIEEAAEHLGEALLPAGQRITTTGAKGKHFTKAQREGVASAFCIGLSYIQHQGEVNQ